MTLIYEERLSDSPYVEKVMRGWTETDGSLIRPAEINWHMVLSKHNGNTHLLVVGPWTESGITIYAKDAEILWIKFRLGVFMPHLCVKDYLNSETILPEAAGQSFWLKNSTWEVPDYENADTFIGQLIRDDLLVCDPIISRVLQGQPRDLSPRTVRHRFLRATGLSQKHIQQMTRAQQAQTLLRQGLSILDVVFQLGYYDQPHLTRSLKQFIGYTPAQIAGTKTTE